MWRKLEKTDEERTVQWAERNGWVVEKVKFANAGYPDRVFIAIEGLIVFIEFKRLGEKPEPLQYHRLKVLNDRGLIATWTDNYDDAIAFLSKVLSDKGYEVYALPDGSRSILRPRIGKDGNLLERIHDPAQERFSEEDARYRATASGLQGLAR